MDGDTPGPSRWAAEAEWMSLLGRVTALEPYSDGHPEGTRAASKLVQDLLDARGFETRVVDQDGRDGAGIVVASRPPRGGAGNGLWVGLFGHVDIERIDQEDTGRTWRTDDPLVPTVVVAAASESAPDAAPPRDRLYCRGVGDNLGPLLQRILCLSDDDDESPGLLFILHGEEEIGSPWAHEQYPLLVGDGDGREPLIDNVALWLEETGYFLANGDQRILNVNTGTDNPITPAGLQAAILGAVRDEAAADGRGTTTLDRPLNKAFGVEKCPCLTHLLTGRPAMYLAIGPNDVDTHIHEPDESIPMDTLDISARQFRGVLTAVASWEP